MVILGILGLLLLVALVFLGLCCMCPDGSPAQTFFGCLAYGTASIFGFAFTSVVGLFILSTLL